jgi:predicted phosphodiesterase
MTFETIVKYCLANPSFFKRSKHELAKVLQVDVVLAEKARKQARKILLKNNIKHYNANETRNKKLTPETVQEYEKFLIANGIHRNNVKSVKYWQNMGGDFRFSVVTNEQANPEALKEDFLKFVESHSPTVEKPKRLAQKNPVVLEISIPDIHYGKLTDTSLEQFEQLYMDTVIELLEKAGGLEIKQILLPIGNDGLNTDNLNYTTTAGTPQHDSVHWMKSFQGYWKLLVKAVDYLKLTAPVHVVVVQGNHDYERMYYVGEVLSAWYKKDENVSVDNTQNSRKYFNFGVNLIMYTHGNNEKAAELPLIMATEQPLLFSNAKFREIHCGHLHKEMVNEYRGIKVRFIPSICPADLWHKKMGYEAQRAAQAYIWSYTNGYEGHLQCSILNS